MTELLPCPFCGASISDDDFFLVVECPACGAKGPQVRGKNFFQAVELWNRRENTAHSIVVEAGSIRIGHPAHLHMVLDSDGQRIYDGDRRVWP